MGNKNIRSQAELHAFRVRLFQMLCALDGTELVTREEVEPRIYATFAEGLEEPGGTLEPEEGIVLPADMEEFSSSCAAVCAVRAALPQIDELISEHSQSWRVDRMSLTDRTVIRLAVYECVIAKTVPVGVAISEAVLIAREFGSDESPRFVNGVLAKIAQASAR